MACGYPALPADSDGGASGPGDGGAGGPSLELIAGSIGGNGNADGTGAAARFSGPNGTAVDAAGNVYVADAFNCTIRKVTPGGAVTTLAGKAGLCASQDGTGPAARFGFPVGLAVDSAGNVYVADGGSVDFFIAGSPFPFSGGPTNSTIRKISPDGTVITLAGSPGVGGISDGTGSAARFNAATSIAVDASGNLFVTDQVNSTIRKVTPAGVVTTFAGTAGQSGSANGAGSAASFNLPSGIAIDTANALYVADQGNSVIRKISSIGVVTTLAGTAGMTGSADGKGAAARFKNPLGVAVDSAGNVYVADQDNNTIRKITQDGTVTTVAGVAGTSGSADGTGAAAKFDLPGGLAVDSAGNAYIADRNNTAIRKLTVAGAVTTLAGQPALFGNVDGPGVNARFGFPVGLAVDGPGNIYVSDQGNNTIRAITPAGVVSTLAGAGVEGSTDGTGAAAQFGGPQQLVIDPDGNLYVADQNNSAIRKVTPAGVVTTLAGSPGHGGATDGTGAAARFVGPEGMAIDSANNLYVADQENQTIRKVTLAGVVTTLAGTANATGSLDGTGAAARFNAPDGLAVDATGNIYVADFFNQTIRKITPAGVVTTLAGIAGQAGSADGQGAAARFNGPSAVEIDSAGNLYVADMLNATIRKITPDGTVTTFAGVPGAAAIVLGAAPRLARPLDLAIIGDSLIIADTGAILRLPHAIH